MEAGRFSIVVGDITQSDAEAIVNAANTTLLGGSGVDRGHPRCRRAGAFGGVPYLGRLRNRACQAHRRLPPAIALCPPHSRPIWRGGGHGEAALLASCYRSCLTLAAEHGIQTVDFPSISTGVYGYPMAQAAPVALRTILDFLSDHELPRQVRLVCRREETAAVYRQAWNLWYAGSKADRMV